MAAQAVAAGAGITGSCAVGSAQRGRRGGKSTSAKVAIRNCGDFIVRRYVRVLRWGQQWWRWRRRKSKSRHSGGYLHADGNRNIEQPDALNDSHAQGYLKPRFDAGRRACPLGTRESSSLFEMIRGREWVITTASVRRDGTTARKVRSVSSGSPPARRGRASARTNSLTFAFYSPLSRPALPRYQGNSCHNCHTFF